MSSKQFKGFLVLSGGMVFIAGIGMVVIGLILFS
jgi:hypothetical protein